MITKETARRIFNCHQQIEEIDKLKQEKLEEAENQREREKEDAKKYADWVFKRWGADSDACIYESNIDDPETLKMIRKEDEK